MKNLQYFLISIAFGLLVVGLSYPTASYLVNWYMLSLLLGWVLGNILNSRSALVEEPVAVLVVLVCEGREYAVLAVQPRLAAGRMDFQEVCAGVLDGSGNFVGVAAKELDEELRIKIAPSELVNLTQLAGMAQGVCLSPGASEEFIHFFALVRHVSREEMEEMNGRIAGLAEEGEQILLKIVPLESLQAIGDGKTLIIHSLFERLRHHVPGAIGDESVTLELVGKPIFFDSH